MDYLFTLLEGIASFISPCLLPMIPIYISYFAGKENKSTKKTFINAIGFVLGFTIVFVILSIFASTLGGLVATSIKYIKIIFGIFVIILGLNYIGILNIKILNKTKSFQKQLKNVNFFKTFIFGILFSLSYTPCIGAFLSSALLLIAKGQDVFKGIILIILYSMGMGIPFIISALLLEKLKVAFDFIKKHYEIIQKISGLVLLVMGIYIIVF